jgi:hypothetical protein
MNADLDQTIDAFQQMESGGLDINGPLKWGYFFMDSSHHAIDAIQRKLGSEFRHESTHQADDGDWVLQVSKIEALTPQALHERNIAFNELAASNGISSYDGWDVGPVE